MPRRNRPLTAQREPVLTIKGKAASPMIRGGGQILTGAFLVDGLLAWDVTLTERQVLWLGAALTMVINVSQNLIEKWRHRKLIGPPVA